MVYCCVRRDRERVELVAAGRGDEAAPARSDFQYLGLNGRMLSDEEMSDMRGGFIRGNRATITVDDQITTDYDPNSPGSASVTVNLGPNTVSRASATTTGTNGYASATVTITGAVTFGGSALNRSRNDIDAEARSLVAGEILGTVGRQWAGQPRARKNSSSPISRM